MQNRAKNPVFDRLGGVLLPAAAAASSTATAR